MLLVALVSLLVLAPHTRCASPQRGENSVLTDSYEKSRGSTTGSSVEAVRGLLERVLPQHSDRFVLEEIPLEGYGVFEIDSDFDESKVILRGSSGVELASALNWYLKDFCSAMVSWTGDQLDLPDPLPLPELRRTERTMKYSYYQNTCTASYTFAFYDWDKWEREIDWMALNGVNFPLAFNGQEYIFARTYERFNVSFDDLGDFFAGPAFQTWQRMGNLYEWGGPQSRQFVEDQRDLQILILERMRSFGMTPILTAFSGVVPDKLRELNPEKEFTQSGWGPSYDFRYTYLLDASDPLFLEIGSAFIEIQAEVYGTDHFYNTDTFNENTPPTSDPEFLRTSANAVYESMRRADPDAVWIMQGWLFYYESNFWQLPQVEGLLSGVPDDKMIILDLFTDSFPVWQDVNSFFGKSFIWCELHNFGGSIGMYGRTHVISQNAILDYYNPESSMIGIGLTMEGTNQNYIVYDLMMEQAYRTEPTDMNRWMCLGSNPSNSWVARRYGARAIANETVFNSLCQAWTTLQRGIYSGEPVFLYATPLARNPVLDPAVWSEESETVESEKMKAYKTMPRHQQSDLFAAWRAFAAAANSVDAALLGTETFPYDLVDITRQVLTEVFKDLRFQFSRGYHTRDVSLLRLYAPLMLELIADLDELLCSESAFLMGTWIQDARRLAPEGEEDAFEFNARNQITLWGGTISTLNDYATKEWCGLVGDYHFHRYSEFINFVTNAVETGTNYDQVAFNAEMLVFGLDWDTRTDPDATQFPETPVGNSVEISLRLFEKYSPLASKMIES